MTRAAPRTGTPSSTSDSGAGALSAGMKLGRYELLHPIASGGMAQVWAAEQAGDLGFRKLIALKTIRPDFAFDPTFRAMFLDEAQLASRIRHANVVEVLDLGAEGHIVFQAMTFVEGAPLSAWLNKAGSDRLPLGAGLRIAIDMLHGLHAAHELLDDDGKLLGLVHRDVSPQNVLIGLDGIAKLADFGIAKAFGRTTEETTYGDVKGKLGYVAPELLDGHPASPQSDLFSAGVVLWETLTGRRLFKIRPGEDTVGARKRMVDYDPREVVPELSPRLASIAMMALERDPYGRFRTSLEMADALEEVVRIENIDATHRHVAASLAADLGPTISELRDTIRAARRGSSGAGPISEPRLMMTPRAATTPHVATSPRVVTSPRVATTSPEPVVDVTVGPTVTVAGPPAADERPMAVTTPPATSRASALMVATSLVLTVLCVMGAIFLMRPRRDAVQTAPPELETSTAIAAPAVPPVLEAAPQVTPTPTPTIAAPTVELDALPTGSPAPVMTQVPASTAANPHVTVTPITPRQRGGRSHGPAASAPTGTAPATPAPRFESPY